MRKLRFVLIVVGGALVGGVLSNGTTGCTDPAPCAPLCSRGYYCDDGVCKTHCNWDGGGCPSGTYCDLRNMCVSLTPDAGPVPDSGKLDAAMGDAKPASGGDMAMAKCSPMADTPVFLAHGSDGNYVINGTDCYVLYSNGDDLHEVKTDGTGEAQVFINTDGSLNTMVSADHQIAGVCDKSPKCWLHTIGSGTLGPVIFDKASIGAGAISSDGKFALAVAHAAGNTIYSGPIEGPFASTKFNAPDPAWVGTSSTGNIYALALTGVADGGASTTDLKVWKDPTSAPSLISSLASEPTVVSNGIYFAGNTNGDVGTLRFWNESLPGGAYEDLGLPVQPSYHIYPSPDGMRVTFFRNTQGMTFPIFYTATSSGPLSSFALTLSGRSLAFTPSFSADGKRVLFGDACNTMTNQCAMTVLDIAKNVRYPLGNAASSSPMYLSASGEYAFLGDGAQVIHVVDKKVLHGAPVNALNTLRSTDGKRFAWIEQNPMDASTGSGDAQVSGGTTAWFFDETAGAGAPMPVADPEVADAHSLLGEGAGSIIYSVTQSTTSLRAYVNATQTFQTLVPGTLGSSAPQFSVDKGYAVYKGMDTALYLVKLP